MTTTTETDPTGCYTMGVDWTNGRTPTYERHFLWVTSEKSARRFYEKRRGLMGRRTALIAPDGTILVEHS